MSKAENDCKLCCHKKKKSAYENLSFMEAMNLLFDPDNDVCYVKRDYWDDGVHVSENDCNLWLHFNNDTFAYVPDKNDIVNHDWLVYEE